MSEVVNAYNRLGDTVGGFFTGLRQDRLARARATMEDARLQHEMRRQDVQDARAAEEWAAKAPVLQVQAEKSKAMLAPSVMNFRELAPDQEAAEHLSSPDNLKVFSRAFEGAGVPGVVLDPATANFVGKDGKPVELPGWKMNEVRRRIALQLPALFDPERHIETEEARLSRAVTAGGPGAEDAAAKLKQLQAFKADPDWGVKAAGNHLRFLESLRSQGLAMDPEFDTKAFDTQIDRLSKRIERDAEWKQKIAEKEVDFGYDVKLEGMKHGNSVELAKMRLGASAGLGGMNPKDRAAALKGVDDSALKYAKSTAGTPPGEYADETERAAYQKRFDTIYQEARIRIAKERGLVDDEEQGAAKGAGTARGPLTNPSTWDADEIQKALRSGEVTAEELVAFLGKDIPKTPAKPKPKDSPKSAPKPQAQKEQPLPPAFNAPNTPMAYDAFGRPVKVKSY